MNTKRTDGCPGSCHSCAFDCENGERPQGFFDKLEKMSEHFSEIGEENLIRILNETVAEWEKEDLKKEEP